jgi:hypothetical protein
VFTPNTYIMVISSDSQVIISCMLKICLEAMSVGSRDSRLRIQSNLENNTVGV